MAEWPEACAEFKCACRFTRPEAFGMSEPIEWCGFHASLREKAQALIDAINPQEPLFAAYGMAAVEAHNDLHAFLTTNPPPMDCTSENTK